MDKSEHKELTWLLAHLAPDTPHVIVDAGCGDGQFFSNSYLPIELGWEAILIDANAAKVGEAAAIHANNPRVTCIAAMLDSTAHPGHLDTSKPCWTHAHVEAGGTGTTTPLSELATGPIGILSIDLEGRDTDVLSEYLAHATSRPHYIIIEGNDPMEQAAQRAIASGDGYSLIATYGVNQIFERGNKA